MLTDRGGIFDFVKLLDFGLVKAADTDRELRLTSAGSLTGTPLYVSPEAIENSDTVDARTDIYALGAVGYWLLTGTPLYEGKSALEIIQKHSSSAPERPSLRVRRPINPELESLIMKCLAKKREDRPGSAAELGEALANLSLECQWTTKDAEHWWEIQGLRTGGSGYRTDTQESRLLATMVGESIGDDELADFSIDEHQLVRHQQDVSQQFPRT
jgi:serine/threonine protein kinase